MAEVVNSVLATCPSCGVQAIIRAWSCGCQGLDYPDHLEACAVPEDYFMPYLRHCQEMDEHGKNPQKHLRLISDALAS